MLKFNRIVFLAITFHIACTALATEIHFNRDIRPILAEHCFQCHGSDVAKVKSGLRLDHFDSATRPAKSGALPIVPGKPDKSEVLSRINTASEDDIMPPIQFKRPLTGKQKELLALWIQNGAKYEQHWAFNPLKRPDFPSVPVDQSNWVRNPIDNFVLHELNKHNLKPQPETTREVLLRRVSLDLTGLPPTDSELKAFLADTNPDAYEKCVDRLLRSRHYGENMAVHWLDVARYADSHGYQRDSSRVMWPWRDWVIAKLNANVPFDQFSIEQLAGDLIPQATQSQVVATGFLRNNRINTEGGIIEKEWRVENIIDRVETVGTTWLGLTLNCCRCHDHKYDPISQREFYELFAFFNDSSEKGAIPKSADGSGNVEPIVQLFTDSELNLKNQKEGKLTQSKKKLEEALASAGVSDNLQEALVLPSQQRDEGQEELVKQFLESNPSASLRDASAEYQDDIATLRKTEESLPTVMVAGGAQSEQESHILIRGKFDAPGEEVHRGTPRFLPPFPAGASLDRLGLARWIFSKEQSLPARVWVNRAWEHFFGTGICKTSEDLGTQAEIPSHLDLLDWLAVEFTQPSQSHLVSGAPLHAWDMKGLHKLIVMSATYRQSSHFSANNLAVDPENRLLAHGPRFRLHAEAVRDQALFISGLMSDKLGGPSVRPYMPPGIWQETSQTGDLIHYHPETGDALYRRSIYTFLKRTSASPFMQFFDAPSREVCTVRRARTNTPLQALATLNETTFVECARSFAQLTLNEGGSTHEERICWAFNRATCREPDKRELDILLKGLEKRLMYFKARKEDARNYLNVGTLKIDQKWSLEILAAYAVTCSQLLNMDEVLTRE